MAVNKNYHSIKKQKKSFLSFNEYLFSYSLLGSWGPPWLGLKNICLSGPYHIWQPLWRKVLWDLVYKYSYPCLHLDQFTSSYIIYFTCTCLHAFPKCTFCQKMAYCRISIVQLTIMFVGLFHTVSNHTNLQRR